MVWYSHLFKSFPQFVKIHTVKGFSRVDEAERDVFLEFPCFLYDPANVGNLTSGSPAFSKPSLNIWKFTVHVLLKPAWIILSITLLACEMMEEELKRLLMKVKEESEKIGLKLSIQKTKIMASGLITLWQIDGETMESVTDFISGGLQNHCRW